MIPNVFPIFINFKSNSVLTRSVFKIKDRTNIISFFSWKFLDVVLIVF